MANTIDLSGKNILVTGASSGIGAAVCIYLSQCGARVQMVARRKEKLEEILSQTQGTGHRIYPFDLTRLEEIEPLVRQMVEENGKLDGMLYAAGFAHPLPLARSTYEAIHKMLLTNFYPYIELIRILSQKKNYNPGMSIVGISSISSVLGNGGQTAYAASKAAMDAASRCIAKELRKKEIRVNTLRPAWVRTRMLESAQENRELDNNRVYQDKIAQPEEVAHYAAYLLSDLASYVNASSPVIDYGYTAF